jgi:RHS repeat-associated protein
MNQHLTSLLKALINCFATSCVLICIASAANAQNIQFTQGSVGSGLDNTVQVSLWTYPGRGATSLPVTLSYSSRVWRVGHLKTVNRIGYQSIAEAIYAEYSTAGWKASLDLPIIEWPKVDDTFYYTGAPLCQVCGSNFRQFRVGHLFIHMPDGSTHELRSGDQPYEGSIIMAGTFYAVDGSRMRYDSTGQNTGTLYLADGAHYVLNGSTAQYVDRNGNTLNYNASTREWTDTLGRHIGNPLPANPQAGQPTYYTPLGFTAPYTFQWKLLSDALTPVNNQTPALEVTASQYLPHPDQMPTDSGGSNFPQTNQSPSLFNQAIGDENDENAQYTLMVGRNQSQNQLFNPVVLSEIVLPNGLSYKFSYNIYGEIDKITYPTGAYEQVAYDVIPPIGDLKPPYTEGNRGVVDRKLSANGTGNDIAEWTYSGGSAVITATAPDETGAPQGIRTITFRQNYATPMHTGTHGNISYYWPFGFEDARQGDVIEERIYAPGAQGAMLRRALTQFDQTSNTVQPSIPGLDNTTKTAYRNSRSIKTVSLILDTGGDALAKTVTHEYTSNGYELTTGLDRTASTETYFAPITNPTPAQDGAIGLMPTGLLASRAETTYLNDSAYLSRNILGLPTSVVLRDGNFNIVSKSESFYDESAYSLLTYSDLTGPDYTDPNTTARGHVTTVRRYSDVDASVYLDSHAQFDQCGNLRNAWNERGIESSIDYSATYKHAFATQATTAVPDPNGTHGSSTAFTSSSTFDSNTGLVLTATDANGQTTSFSYTDDQSNVDVLNRLRKVTRPDGGWTKYSFGETLGNLYTMTEAKLDATRTVKTYQYADPLGRASRGFASEGNDSYIASDTIYDLLGRVWKVSNPYRTTTLGGTADLSHTNDWSVSHFDVLSRVDSVTLPDSSVLQTSYQGIYTTVTDQAGRQRRQKTDALGRVVRVDEPDTSGSLGTVDSPTQASYYDYNTQGNLIHITQGAGSTVQNRYFKYDALGRLTYERQVEQAGTFTATDALTGNSSWSRHLVYDENVNSVNYGGLLTSAYDARTTSTQFRYDQLNRIYQVSYSDGTPAVTNNYDQARTGYVNKGRLTEALTASTSSLPATSEVYNFDLMGRVANNQQTVGDQSYSMNYGYSLGGALTSETYPSGRVVSYAFDDGARLSQVSSGSTVYANQFDYSSSQGLLKAVTLGNGAVESYDYNSRLQMKSIDLTKSGTQIQHYDYKYGVYDPSSNTLDETKNNGQIARIEGTIATTKQWQQNFAYDSLGRLSSAREFRGDNNQQSYLVNYDYDLFGNRYQKQSRNNGNPFAQIWTEDSDITQPTNRFASNVTYDYAGNITVDSKFRQLKFQYDANNRQKQSSNLDDTGAVVSVYDAGGQRLATQVGSTLTNICVYDAMGKLLAEYGPASSGPGGTTYLTSDHQGSPRVVTNGSGTVVSRHDYLPFGEELSAGVGLRNSNQGYGGADAARQKYAGMESDDGSGMATTLWRKYDSSSGRWTGPDPYGGSMTIASPQTFNRYSYVSNDPVNMRDPSGLMQEIPSAEDPPGADPPAKEDPPPLYPETGRSIIDAADSRQESAIGDRLSELGNAPATGSGGKDGGTTGDDGKSGGDPAGGEPQNAIDTKPTDLEARVKTMAKKNAQYLNEFLDALGKDVESHDFGVLYKRVTTIEVDDAPLIRAGEPDAAGLSETKGGGRQIYVHHDYNAAANGPEFRWNKITAVVIFELLHHARHRGTYDDAALDRATLKLLTGADLASANALRARQGSHYRNGTIAGQEFRKRMK